MQCPICHKPVDESMLDQPKSTFPFCSERCRLIDLARWADEKYQIPAEIDPDENETTDERG